MVAGKVVVNGQGGYGKTSGLTGAGPLTTKKELTESEKIAGKGAIVPSLNNAFNIAAFPEVGSNPLNKYASYNCLFTFAALSKDMQNAGKFDRSSIKNVIARSAGDWGDPSKRVMTQFGQFDYFLDDLIIVSLPSLNKKSGETSATKITFKITEPYSMGLFLIAMQQGALAGGYGNFREAGYILMIEFAGFDDNGNPLPPDLSMNRYIPIKILEAKLKVTGSGSVYECEANPYNEIAFREPISNTNEPVSLEGTLVKDLLNFGSTSLQGFLKREAETRVKDKEVKTIDRYEIHFPKDFTDPSDSGNEISESTVFLLTDPGNMRFPNQNDIYDPAKEIFKNKSVGTVDKRTYNFKKNTKIQDIITEVVLRSDYISKQLTKDAVRTNTKGMIKWFRIETHVHDLEENKQLNRQNRKIIFRVVPYEVHISKLLPANAIPEGYAVLKKTVNRIYDYLYTGKNTEIISVDLDFNFGFYTKLSSDAGANPGTNSDNQNVATNNKEPLSGVQVAKTLVKNNEHQISGYYGNTDVKTTSGADKDDTAQIKNFREIFTNPGDMVELNMTIRGDPYYLANSGFGNQIKKPKGDNLMEDGSMNYQSGEVDIVLNFRTPIDFDLMTGLYKFNTSVDQFSGLYQIMEVESKFNQNKFTQSIKANRRRTQVRGSGEKSVILGNVK